MQIAQYILQIVASLGGILASWFVGKEIVKWLQAYRTSRQKVESTAAKKESEELNRKANADSDKLKDIEGR